MAKARKTDTRKASKTPARKRPAKPLALVRGTKRAPARREASGVLAQLQRGVQPLTQAVQRIIGKDPDIADLGAAEVDLSPGEIQRLYADFNDADVEVLPSGAIYLPHTWYTERFNEAVGPTGWALVPATTPQSGGEKTIVSGYILYIHGKPWAFAWGEHDYHADNRNQTYGDAAESTVASALRRCAKRRGIAMKLWKRSYVREFLKAHAVKVEVDTRGRKSDQWRRKDGPALKGEVRRTGRNDVIDAQVVEQSLEIERSASAPAQTGDYLSLEQQGRLARIVGRSNRSQAEVAGWLERRYGVKDSLGEIRQADYDVICRVIENPGKLPVK